MPTQPEQSYRAASKSERVLACVSCQQRKVRCDRKVPCSTCVKSGTQCVPAALLPRQRRRRFPERELLERLRHYEDLLRQNNIEFKPLHPTASERAFPLTSGDTKVNMAATSAGEPSVQYTRMRDSAANIWHAMYQRSQSPEDDQGNIATEDEDSDGLPDDLLKAWDQLYDINDHLFFGLRKTNVDLSTLHPQQVHIFRLWQIYLERVEPLLKVTHNPTLQPRIIDAASDVSKLDRPLEALMFSIYSISILSLLEEECLAFFGNSRKDLLTSYQLSCQQALLNAGIFLSSDYDSLVAFYLYLISVRPETDPRSLSSMLGVTIRIAHRTGIQSESANAKLSALEAEMRRRLWWSLVMFDARVSEMCVSKASLLTPVWDCAIPANVNDFDLQPDMKTPPAVHGTITEAIFVATRSEMGEWIRHSPFFLDLINPALKPIAKFPPRGSATESGELVDLEKIIEERYLRLCNPENPLHFMTIWTSRGYLAKQRLLEHYSKHSKQQTQQTDAQRDVALAYAQSMLECDTKLMASPLTKGYLWFLSTQFAFPGYVHILADLRRRPHGEHVSKSWNVIGDNYVYRVLHQAQRDNPFFRILGRLVLQAWAACDAASKSLNQEVEPPHMVSDIKSKMSGTELNVTEQSSDTSLTMPMGFGNHGLLYGIGSHDFADLGLEDLPNASGQISMQPDLRQFDWAAMYEHGW